MSTIVTRTGKGSALTWAEADANFTNLNMDKVEYSALAASTGSSLSGFIQSGTGAVATTVQDKLRETVSVVDFGATGDGTTDDTAAIQAALTAVTTAGGGSVYFPPGTYILTQSVVVGSKTRVYGAGGATLIKASQTSWVGVGATAPMFKNENWGAVALTDEDIIFEDLTTDYGTVTIVGGGAHAFSMRFVSRVTMRNVVSYNGENCTAFLACQDTHTENCTAIETGNCGFDHWDGSGNCRVIACTVRCTDSTNAQGIQFTGVGTSGEDRSALDCLVMGCSVYGIRGTGSAAGIISNANDTGSYTYRFRSIGNHIEDCDIGLSLSGNGGQHISIGDTFYNVTYLPIFIQAEGGTRAPDNCRVLNPHLIDCDHDPGNIALIQVSGDNNSVKGIRVTNTDGVADYALIAWVTNDANNTMLDIDSAPNGSGGRFQDDGTNTQIVDTLSRYDATGTWTPTVKFGGADTGITYSARSGTYTRIGDTVYADMYIQLSNKGSATGAATIDGLPFAVAGAPCAFVGYYGNFTGISGAFGGYATGTSIALTEGRATGTAASTHAGFNNNSEMSLSITFQVS